MAAPCGFSIGTEKLYGGQRVKRVKRLTSFGIAEYSESGTCD
jgi:hypothetical protein